MITGFFSQVILFGGKGLTKIDTEWKKEKIAVNQ